MRGLRLLLGVVVLVQSIIALDIFLGAMSLFLVSMAVFNFGCCRSGGCGVYFNKSKSRTKVEDVSYEEVVDKK